MNKRWRALGAMTVLIALAGCGQDISVQDGPAQAATPLDATLTNTPPTATAATAAWTKVAAWPNVPWYNALTAWTGSEALIFGGRLDRGGLSSGPPADIGVGQAAGAYDPATDTWRAIPVAPFSLYRAQLVVAGESAYALAFGSVRAPRTTQLWAYSFSTGKWRPLAAPPDQLVTQLSVAGGSLVALGGATTETESNPLQIYDIAKDAWHAGPDEPWKGLGTRTLVGMPDGRAVLLDVPADAADAPTAEHPAPMWRAAVLDPSARTWRIMPPSDIPAGDVGGYPTWTAVGRLVVNADPRTLPAADVTGIHLGDVPLGGILDVDAGRWEPLPRLPGQPHVHRSGPKDDPHPTIGWDTRDMVRATGGDNALAFGWTYNARHRTWTELPPVPRNRAGLSYFTAIWTADRLLLWANAKVDPSADGLGYRIVPTHAAWTWKPA